MPYRLDLTPVFKVLTLPYTVFLFLGGEHFLLTSARPAPARPGIGTLCLPLSSPQVLGGQAHREREPGLGLSSLVLSELCGPEGQPEAGPGHLPDQSQVRASVLEALRGGGCLCPSELLAPHLALQPGPPMATISPPPGPQPWRGSSWWQTKPAGGPVSSTRTLTTHSDSTGPRGLLVHTPPPP